jgi:hypothetical protein
MQGFSGFYADQSASQDYGRTSRFDQGLNFLGIFPGVQGFYPGLFYAGQAGYHRTGSGSQEQAVIINAPAVFQHNLAFGWIDPDCPAGYYPGLLLGKEFLGAVIQQRRRFAARQEIAYQGAGVATALFPVDYRDFSLLVGAADAFYRTRRCDAIAYYNVSHGLSTSSASLSAPLGQKATQAGVPDKPRHRSHFMAREESREGCICPKGHTITQVKQPTQRWLSINTVPFSSFCSAPVMQALMQGASWQCLQVLIQDS